MKKKKYNKPLIKRKKIAVQFFTQSKQQPNSDIEYMLLAQGTGGTGCVLPSTKITLFDDRQIAIADVKVGDPVLSYDRKKQTYVKNFVKKVAVHKDEASEYFLLNKKLSITGNHLLLINETEWKMVRDLRIGDILHNYHNLPEPVTSIELIDKKAPLIFNLELEEKPGNYLADGICIHW